MKMGMVGEYLFDIFLDEEVEDLSVFAVKCGVLGMFRAFESWLEYNNYIRQEQGGAFRQWEKE